MKKLFLVVIVISHFGCSAQDYESGKFEKVLPGDKSMNLDELKLHTVVYTRPNGSMTYSLDERTLDGRDLFQLSIRFESGGKVYPDTIYFDKKTFGLAGRKVMNRKQGFRADIDIEGKDLKASVTELPGKTVPFKGNHTYTYPHEIFEISVLNYAIKTLPLKEGYKASVPVFQFNLQFSIGWVDVIVEGKETLKINGKNYEVWKVNALGGAIGDKTFWLSDNLPYALRIESKGLRPWTFDREL